MVSPRGGAALGWIVEMDVAGRGQDAFRMPKEMTTVQDLWSWELVKKNNCFLIQAGFGNSNAKVQFSKEPLTTSTMSSYKFSGLANSKTVAVQPSAEDKGCRPVHDQNQKQNTPAKLQHKTLMHKEFPQDG
ncbi:hypothetical protein ZWY2020_044618 [Hordeum vulgare]|nr:hypothetical protein ZWY2020_044618 [Hordeum vulgare]